MQGTKDIPIVFAAAGDPVGTGVVASLARPGGNVTGLSNQQTDLAGNRLELLREVVPTLKRLAVMGNVSVPNVTLEMNEVQNVAPRLGVEVTRLEIHRTEEIRPRPVGDAELTGRHDDRSRRLVPQRQQQCVIARVVGECTACLPLGHAHAKRRCLGNR